MELDVVNSNGYQGSNTNVSTNSVEPITNDTLDIKPKSVLMDDTQGIRIEDVNVDNRTKSIGDTDIKKAISEINSKLNKNTEAIFGIHDETNRVTIKIVDKDTKEVIKEIPPEKTLEMIVKVWEFAGLIVDEKR